MFNNRNTNFIFINYINKVNQALNHSFYEINDITETNSISHNFISKMLPYMKFVLKISDFTSHYTNNPKILGLTQNFCKTYPEIIDDMQKIENISLKFRSCRECILNYNNNSDTILKHAFSDFKKINCKQNVNYYFLKAITIYCQSESKLLQNLLTYKIFPQLRLIAEYMLCLNNQKLKETDRIIN